MRSVRVSAAARGYTVGAREARLEPNLPDKEKGVDDRPGLSVLGDRAPSNFIVGSKP